MQSIRTTLIAILLAVSIASAQQPSPPSAASPVPEVQSSAAPAASSPATSAPAPVSTVASTSVAASASPSSTATTEQSDEGSYYPSGKSYDDDPNVGTDVTMTGGNDGESKTFMGMSMPAQIGIICAVVIGAVGMFACVVAYYFWRRRQWEKNVERRSMILTQKAAAMKAASTSATSSASQSTESLPEKDLEKGEPIKSEFDAESRQPSTAPAWKRWLIRK